MSGNRLFLPMLSSLSESCMNSSSLLCPTPLSSSSESISWPVTDGDEPSLSATAEGEAGVAPPTAAVSPAADVAKAPGLLLPFLKRPPSIAVEDAFLFLPARSDTVDSPAVDVVDGATGSTVALTLSTVLPSMLLLLRLRPLDRSTNDGVVASLGWPGEKSRARSEGDFPDGGVW